MTNAISHVPDLHKAVDPTYLRQASKQASAHTSKGFGGNKAEPIYNKPNIALIIDLNQTPAGVV
jgi:hypothetical protein